ncbi:LOW QUALITY PROTEIN: immunoglobulin superfamily member 8, partial [Mantella aurantiaca]
RCREVRVQEGPLYRVVDNGVSIGCNVSGYEGPPTQNFEWFMYRPSAPDISISIASTKDPNFPYAVYSPRVQRGDIFIQRLTGDSAHLHIKQLRHDDEGVYECYTPTTDSAYLGSYSAKVALKVIPDTLQVYAKMAAKGRVSASSPLQLSLVEGRELHLSCMASEDSAQHTHLSVTFGVSDPGAPVGRGTLRDIISIGRDFTVEPSNEHEVYTERYRNGEIRLEKIYNSTYQMVITRLRPQDTGTYHCTASQWILDPDRTWQRITEKRSMLALLSVQPIDSLMKVLVFPRELRVQSGGLVELFCNVSLALAPPPDMALSLDWLVTSSPESPGQLVASVSPEGVVSLGERYAGGDTGTRHISLEKISPNAFRLRIYSAQPGDTGAYSCRARAWVSYSGPRLGEGSYPGPRLGEGSYPGPRLGEGSYPGPRLEEVSSQESQTSTDPNLQPVTPLSYFSLSVHSFLHSVTLYRGDTAVLLCNVTVETPQPVHVAVSWWVELAGEKPNERMGRLLASVNRQGVSEAGSRLSGEELSTDKVGAQCYRLRLHNINMEDEGLYHCAVTAWIQYPDHTWYNSASAKSNSIRVYPYAQAMDMLLIPVIGGVASALFVGISILSAVTCCYIRRLRKR